MIVARDDVASTRGRAPDNVPAGSVVDVDSGLAGIPRRPVHVCGTSRIGANIVAIDDTVVGIIE